MYNPKQVKLLRNGRLPSGGLENDVPDDRDQRPPAFFAEVWGGSRPYLVKLVIDTLISISLYVVLYLFKVLADTFPIPGWAGSFIVNLHATGVVLALTTLVGLFVIDIARIRRD